MMEAHPVTRWSGTAFILAGVSLALWPASHPWNQLAGAEVGQSTQWVLSHTFHFLAGFFALFGLAALAAHPRTAPLSRVGMIAFAVAFTGAALFTATGVFTAFLWPTLAVHSPAMVELTGPFFSPPHPLIGITSFVFSGGFVMLAEALRRDGTLSLAASATMTIGALLLIVPPPPIAPVPWFLIVAAGALFGAGLVMLGVALRRGGAAADAGEPVHAAVA